MPVGNAFRFQDTFDNHHPLYAGDVGIAINPALAQRIKQADLLLWNAPDLDYVCYRFGSNLVGTVMKKGRIVHEE